MSQLRTSEIALNQPSSSAIPPKALVLLVILTLVWGTNWPLFRLATLEVSVWTFRSVALLIAGITLLAYAKYKGQALRVPREYWLSIGLATFFYLFLWNIFSTYAAVLIPSGQAAILGFTMPLWSALITFFLLKEKLTVRLIIALLLGAGAVGLLMARSLGVYANAPLGFALGLCSGLGWAIGTLILKRRKIDVPPAVLTGWQLLVTAVPMSIGALALGDHQWFMPTWQSIAVIAYIALVPMSIGNLCWFTIVGMLPANTAGLSSIMVPMVAMLSGALINKEPLGLLQCLAMSFCAASLALTLLKPKPDSGSLR